MVNILTSGQVEAGVFAALVRALRLRAGISINELARRASVDPAYVHRIERQTGGRVTLPRRHVVVALGQALRLTPTELDDLLARAGFCPESVSRLGGWDEALAEIAAVLGDPTLGGQDKAEFREVLRLLAARWAGPRAAATT